MRSGVRAGRILLLRCSHRLPRSLSRSWLLACSPPWVFIPLALAISNVLRLIHGISPKGPAAGQIILVALNAALVAVSVIGLVYI
jgi:hypothetical protein